MPRFRKTFKTTADVLLAVWVLCSICQMPGGLAAMAVGVTAIGLTMVTGFVALWAAGELKH